MTNKNDEAERVTNLDYLLDLSKGNNHFVREMIETFLIENPKEIEQLENAIKQKDFEMIKQAAHLLQSSIAFVGLNKVIEDEVYEIEKIADEKSKMKKVEILPADKSEFQKIEIVRTDKTAVKRIEMLFNKVKKACEKSRLELEDFGK